LFAPYQYLYQRGDLPKSESEEFLQVKDNIGPDVMDQFKSQEFEAEVFYAFKNFFAGLEGLIFTILYFMRSEKKSDWTKTLATQKPNILTSTL